MESVLSAKANFSCFLVSCLLIVPLDASTREKARVAVFSGPRATVQNSPALVTSNKARRTHGLELLGNPDDMDIDYDHLAPQRLAAPVEVFIEMHSAHPLESDAAELYGDPDGYLDQQGNYHEQRTAPGDKPVYKVQLRPEDGLYLLPYMARQKDGSAWDSECAYRGAPEAECRQPFYPDASRIFEEIDRGLLGLTGEGRSNALSSRADYDFIRALPSGGYKKGLPESQRTDLGKGDIPPEVLSEDMQAYKPFHLATFSRFHDLAKASNAVQRAMDSGLYRGGIWFEASPSIEETIYWLNLVTDTTVPLVAVAAQRAHRSLSADGPRNIIDAVDYILSGQWSDSEGKDSLGAVLIEAENIIAGRQVQKTDARPGGYIATGGHGGVLGSMGVPGPVEIYFTPVKLHTWKSAVNLSNLPETVTGTLAGEDGLTPVQVRIRDKEGLLVGTALPRISILKMAHFSQQDASRASAPDEHILGMVAVNLADRPLSGFVAEGESPYGNMTTEQTRALEIATYSGMPVVSVGRGDAGGPTAVRPYNVFIEGNNLTASKARLLLMASILKFGSLPVAQDPALPTADEKRAVQESVARYQEIFDTH